MHLTFVLNFEHWGFDIVSDFGFRYSDFHNACFFLLHLKPDLIAKIEHRTFETPH